MYQQECQTDTKYARRICGKFNGYDNICESRIFDMESRYCYIQCLDNSRAIIQECLGDLADYRTWSRYYAHQHIHQVWWKPDENSLT